MTNAYHAHIISCLYSTSYSILSLLYMDNQTNGPLILTKNLGGQYYFTKIFFFLPSILGTTIRMV